MTDRQYWGLILLLVFFFVVALGLGARIGGVRLSLWKMLAVVAALTLAVLVGQTLSR